MNVYVASDNGHKILGVVAPCPGMSGSNVTVLAAAGMNFRGNTESNKLVITVLSKLV